MRNKKILIIILVFSFLLVNIFSLNAFYNNFLGINLYNKKWYNEAVKYFEKSHSIEGIYNKGNALYKQKLYSWALMQYKSILWKEKNNLNFNLNYNIWNSFYRVWELKKDSNLKIKNREEAIKYYRDSLNIKYDEQAKKNLEFVLDRIKQEKQKQQEKNKKKGQKKDSKKDQNKSGNKADKKSQNNKEKSSKEWDKNAKKDSSKAGKKSWKDAKKDGNWDKSTQKDSKQAQNAKKWDNSWKSSDKKSSVRQLSKEQKSKIDAYKKALREEQKNNSNAFNKVYQDTNNNDPFWNFFNDPFFNNDLLNQWSQKRDW